MASSRRPWKIAQAVETFSKLGVNKVYLPSQAVCDRGSHRFSFCRAVDQPSSTAIKDNRLEFYLIKYSELVVITSTKVFLSLDLHEVLWIYHE